MSIRIRLTGRGVLAAAVVAGMACLGVAAPTGAARAAVLSAGAVRAETTRVVPDFAPGVIPPANDGLGGISCPNASFCLAVGGDPKGPLAEAWNGRTWRVVPAPGGGVSCASARFCMSLNGLTSQRWDGRRWTAPARLPSAIDGTSGLSCVSATFCMVVGTSDHTTNGNQDGCMISAVWNGTAWHTVPIPFGGCGVEDWGLGPVSCASASECVAVGTQDGDEHTLLTLALEWNGKAWQVDAPFGGPDSTLSAVSCASTGFCMALGNTFDGNLAVGWDGTSWTQLSTPPISGGSFSCASADSCVALSGGQILTWNGTAWTSMTISAPAGAGLGGVSCWQATACMAVGSYKRIGLPDPLPGGPGGAQLTLAEEWNGNTWQVRRTPSPGDEQEGLSGVSCRSAANCMAVGAFVNGSDVQAALAERWNGRGWKALPAPNPGPGQNALTAISCPAAGQCVAVGYDDAAGDLQALAEQWNGSTWATLTIPHNGVLNGVSCPAVNDCVAVGSYLPPGQSFPVALTATWDGSTWTVQASPDPGAPAELNAVACPGRTRCIAVGDFQFGLGQLHPLTALWNGTAWTRLTTRAPGDANGWNTLNSVSCPRPSDCMAVGTTFHLPGFRYHPQTLAESWNGTRWTVRPTPTLKYKFQGYLDAVSCPGTTRCRAVGGYLAPQDTGFVLGEAWNGATWRRLVPLTDPSPTFNDLFGISCPIASYCIAVGGTEPQHALGYLWNGTRWRRLDTPNP